MTIAKIDRVITKIVGEEGGPLLIAFGGMHGNEPAGIKAIELLSKMIEVEPITNPEFSFRGAFLGIIGNLKAYTSGKRFVNRDLNRMWTKENVEKAKNLPPNELTEELLEIRGIMRVIDNTIKELDPEEIVLIDLHTTSSRGGIFTITRDEVESLNIALELHAPVIMGMLNGIKGTTLHYFISENFGRNIIPISFESGQHDEKLSVNRAIAALINCMRTIGCIPAEHVENRHDSLLIEHSEGLPKISKLIFKHTINDGDGFKMLPNFKNFQRIQKGQQLGIDKNGPLLAQEDSIMLMPLYQEQGEDGYFLIKSIEELQK